MIKKIGVPLFIFLFPVFTAAQTISDMLENAMSSVVTVAVYKEQDLYKMMGFDEGKTRGADIQAAYKKLLDLTGTVGSGSGFVITRNGKKYVVTNAHVVEKASNGDGSIYVYSINQSKYEVKVLGGDTFYDLAVLEFKNKPGEEITGIEFRDNEIRIGETVYAIGNPLGKYPYSVSNGIVSAKNRVRDGITGRFGYIQTTATLVWGNSGGPLIDTNGKVAGINSQMEIFYENGQQQILSQINFSLESGIASRLVEDIIAKGNVQRAWIGLELTQTSDKTSYKMHDPDNSPVIINKIIPGSPAAEILPDKAGYYLKKINDIEIRNIHEALGEFEKVNSGKLISLTIVKDGNQETIRLTTGELNLKNLKCLAMHVLGNKKLFKLTDNSEGAFLTVNNKTGLWRIMAAGWNSKNSSQMWMINNLGTIGAVLRLTGLYGFIDLCIADSEDYSEQIIKRYYFAESEYENKEVLWY